MVVDRKNRPHVVYCLFSVRYNTTYIGLTHNLAERIIAHNKGKCKWTRHRGPWRIVACIRGFPTLQWASRCERYIKHETDLSAAYWCLGKAEKRVARMIQSLQQERFGEGHPPTSDLELTFRVMWPKLRLGQDVKEDMMSLPHHVTVSTCVNSVFYMCIPISFAHERLYAPSIRSFPHTGGLL